MGSPAPGDRSLQELEQKFDPEMRFRPLSAPANTVVGGLLIGLSLRHRRLWSAGRRHTHRGVHLAFVLGLIFLVFPHRPALLLVTPDTAWRHPVVCGGWMW